MFCNRGWISRGVALFSPVLLCGGCLSSEDVGNLISSLSDIQVQIDSNVNSVQTEDPRAVVLPPAATSQGDTVIIDNSVTVINNVQQDIIPSNLPDETILGIENQTGFDIYVQYFVDGELQGVFVYDGETLLLDYPCVDTVELVSEDDFDPFTGFQVDAFDLSAFFTNPEDFSCGDAFIMTIDSEGISASVSLDFVQ